MCGEFLGIKIINKTIEIKLIADKEEIIELIKIHDFGLYEKEKASFDTLKTQPFNKWRKKIIELINKKENYYLINYKLG